MIPTDFGFTAVLTEAIVSCRSAMVGVRHTVIITGATSGITICRQ